jgi:coenzyme Q-binding protein COQ10
MSSIGVSRELPYRAEQIFDLAADVERYPEFLPLWLSAKIRQRDGDVYYTDQVIGVGPIRQSFRSKTMLRRPDEIEVISTDEAFEKFRLNWSFKPLAQECCEVILTGELELRAPLLRRFFSRVAADGFEPMLAAFEERARELYGPPR